MTPSSSYLTLYSALLLLSINGVFANGLPLDATTMTYIRCVFAAMTLALFIYFSKGKIRLPNIKTVVLVYFLGFILGLHWVSYFYSMQVSSVAIGLLALYTFPIMVLFIEPFFTGKRVQPIDIGLGVLVFIGLCIIVIGQHDPNTDISSNGVFIGVITGIGSAFLFTIRNMVQKYYCPDISSDTLMLHQMLLVCTTFFFFVDTESVAQLPNEYWGYLVLLGVFTTAVAHTLLVKSYKLFPGKTVGLISCLQIVFGSFFAWAFLGETISLSTALGGSIILGVAAYESAKAPV